MIYRETLSESSTPVDCLRKRNYHNCLKDSHDIVKVSLVKLFS